MPFTKAPGDVEPTRPLREPWTPPARRRSPATIAAIALLLATTLTAASAIRLDDPADRELFRQWFTFLAEEQFFREPDALPREVNDCAALVRYAYRESLRRHDGAWAASLGLKAVPPLGSLRQWTYPFGPTRRGLFFTDATGSIAEFADARTLMRFNAFKVAASLEAARPGDLLFFHQSDQRFPFHVMIFLGRSQFENARDNYVVYHTGPEGRSPGEIRRPTLDELRRHPNPQWRPISGNAHFLGVFRWKILGDS